MARPDLLRASLEQLLAGFDPSEISQDDVRLLAESYGIDDEASYEIAMRLWLDALDVVRSIDAPWSAKHRYLRALQDTLDLDEADVEPARIGAVAPHFRRALADAIADRHLTAEERRRLSELATDLGIPAEMAQDAIDRTARTLLDTAWHTVLAGGRLTPDGAIGIRTTAAALGIDPTPAQETMLRYVEAAVAAARDRAEVER